MKSFRYHRLGLKVWVVGGDFPSVHAGMVYRTSLWVKGSTVENTHDGVGLLHPLRHC